MSKVKSACSSRFAYLPRGAPSLPFWRSALQSIRWKGAHRLPETMVPIPRLPRGGLGTMKQSGCEFIRDAHILGGSGVANAEDDPRSFWAVASSCCSAFYRVTAAARNSNTSTATWVAGFRRDRASFSISLYTPASK